MICAWTSVCTYLTRTYTSLHVCKRSRRQAYPFSPYLCVRFLFLILYPAPPAASSSSSSSAPSSHLCHTQLCHTQLFHTQLYHIPSFTRILVIHNFVTHNFVTHNFVTNHLSHTTLSHATLSHTIVHTQLFSHSTLSKQICHTPYLRGRRGTYDIWLGLVARLDAVGRPCATALCVAGVARSNIGLRCI